MQQLGDRRDLAGDDGSQPVAVRGALGGGVGGRGAVSVRRFVMKLSSFARETVGKTCDARAIGRNRSGG
ncbi:hypothetical protein GCM10020000_58350 [Streptomyces olivoverticillatus]